MIRKIIVIAIALVLFGCATGVKTTKNAADNTLPPPSLEKIAEGVWIHKSYEFIEPWGAVLSQGLVIQNDTGVFLVDTTWNNADTKTLLSLIEDKTGEIPSAAIVTHAHQDKMGGMDALHEAGILTWSYALTYYDALERGLTPANARFSNTLTGAPSELKFGKNILAMQKAKGIYHYIPGPGHTRDNIVIYYEPAKILFGGCLIRPGDSNSLGNTADGDVASWANAVRNVATTFPNAQIVIPSHGPMGGRELFDHTIALAEKAASAQKQ